jgi:serine/threonine-protein kinase HipA
MSPPEVSAAGFQPSDTLYLWWLGQPDHPALIGTLRWVRGLRGVSLQYTPDWLQRGFALSEDLPLQGQEFMPTVSDSAVGAVDDARPDRWGERVIRFLDRPSRLSLMEYLLFAGDERFGALGVSVSDQVYRPRWTGPLPQLTELGDVHQAIAHIQAGEAMTPAMQRLVSPGVTMGGARPKALIEMDGHPWVLKFNEVGEAMNTPLVEHATMTLAAQAQIRVAHTVALPLPKAQGLTSGHAVAVQRFDREGPRRRHALSAQVALRAAGEDMGYPELAQLLRRKGVAAQSRHKADMRELYRRMVFNILIDNTDDHEKNHALLSNDRGEYELAPAYDVVPTAQALGYQQMRVGAQGSASTLANALSEAAQFGLTPDEALQQQGLVAQAVSRWAEHFLQAGVCPQDIELLSAQIDRPHLIDQRRQAALRLA